jgi:AcrR family transcriptional regulator
MSTPRTDRTRASILEAARRLIEQSGPEQWTMEAVADDAGVTRMTVYRYFPSRTDLLIATVRHVDETEGAIRLFAPVGEAESGIDALNAWSRILSGYIPRIGPAARALMAAREVDEAAAEAWDDRMGALRRWPLVIARRLESEHRLADDLTVEDAADLIWAIASVQVWDALTNGRSWSASKYQGLLLGVLQRAVTRWVDTTD